MWTMFETRFHWFSTRNKAWFTYQTQKKKKTWFHFGKESIVWGGKKDCVQSWFWKQYSEGASFHFCWTERETKRFSLQSVVFWKHNHLQILWISRRNIPSPASQCLSMHLRTGFLIADKFDEGFPSVGWLVANFVILPKILEKFSQKKNPNLFKFSS